MGSCLISLDDFILHQSVGFDREDIEVRANNRLLDIWHGKFVFFFSKLDENEKIEI